MVLEVNPTDAHSSVMRLNKYEESVDFQNECRHFYLNRVKATERFKKKLNDEDSKDSKEEKNTPLSAALSKLRVEMASLVDQDMSLMKQLLTLNETIEELKNKRLYGVNKGSLDDSTCQLDKSVSTMSIDSGSSSNGAMSEEYTN